MDLRTIPFETADGVITKFESTDNKGDVATVLFQFADASPVEVLLELEPEFVFVGRSRLARLGIDIRSVSEMRKISDTSLEVDVAVNCVVKEFEITDIVREVFVEGFPLGRLVHCPVSKKLDSKEVFDAYRDSGIKLPTGFSIDRNGDISFPPHSITYGISKKLTVDDFLSIALRKDGKDLLSSIFVARPVKNLVIEPGEGVITSCSMFLYEHIVVIDSESEEFGQHLNSTVLDPYLTSGNRIFIEIFNNTDEVIVNPVVKASIYHAHEFPHFSSKVSSQATSLESNTYNRLENVFDFDKSYGYFDRQIAVIDRQAISADDQLKVDWMAPEIEEGNAISRLKLDRPIYNHDFIKHEFATSKIPDETDPAAGKAILLRFFPNVVEHVDLLNLACTQNIDTVIFENASFAHRGYLSARDHARLADFADLGVEVYWLNRERKLLLKHEYRGNRGYFCSAELSEKFKRATVLAVYGSSRNLVENKEPVERLLTSLNSFFGKNLSIITGGGPGAMLTASEIAKENDLLVGANYLEIEDQKANQIADYFQVFQENARHSRQRWFEISAFHLFLVGGVGTLEEVGVTLTDMKLGVQSPSPIVFFGKKDGALYWNSLFEQLQVMTDDERMPRWLMDHLMVTDDVDEVIDFYSKILGVS